MMLGCRKTLKNSGFWHLCANYIEESLGQRGIAENEEWYFAIVDVVGVLTDSIDYKTARNYWKVTKHRMVEEGNEFN